MNQPRRIFEGPAPRVYTLSPAADFLKSLARTLVAEFPDPEVLAGVTVLLPTRRAGRALGEAFNAIQAESGIGAAILPLIRPLGDVDADEPPFEPGELDHLALPAISAARRRFELASLILAREAAARREMMPDGALVLADALASLLDELASEEIVGLGDLAGPALREALPADRQEAAIFLDIVLEQWPAHLKSLGLTDPASRRSALLNALARSWQEKPPPGPVIAAGSTGSIKAAARLLTVVAGLEHGAVVLPGFAGFMDAPSWNAVEKDEGHPQRAMKALIERIGIGPSDVREWPQIEQKYDPGRAAGARVRLVTEALRPADETADWLARLTFLGGEWKGDIVAEGLSGLAVIEAPDPASEARAIALALRETLETPGRTAMVVTPDRALARRITTEMARFGVELDDSAGEALSDTAPGAFLMRVMEVAGDPGSALALAALWTSPLFALREKRSALMTDIAEMERKTLRGSRPGHSFADVIARVEQAGNARWLEIIRAIEAAFAPLMTLEGDQPPRVFASALVAVAEALSASDSLSGADRLWAGEAGESAAILIREFLEEADALPPLSLRAFTRVLLETARTRRVRPRSGAHPRLALLGPLEARLLHADRVILAGLNEGVWPQKLGSDPFLSRAMRDAAGLPPPERRLGLAAHDFAELASLPGVILTRATSADGAPTVASRWLWRLQTLTRGALGKEAAEEALKAQPDYLKLGSALDAVAEDQLTGIEPPLPRPPLAARPDTLPVTAIETWVRDPYAVYAQRILGLKELDPLDREPGPAERGNAWHTALELWVKRLGDRIRLPEDALAMLVAHGEAALHEAGFTEAELATELPRFAHAARWMIDYEAQRRAQGQLPLAMEATGRISFAAGPVHFTLTAKPDRIDKAREGHVIVDYKTGRVPSEAAVDAGFSPQLTLTGAILAKGGFEGVQAGPIHRYRYVAVKGTKTAGEELEIPGLDKKGALKADPEEMHAKALERLVRYAAKFADENAPYESQPRRQFVNDFGTYDHLARRKEWSTAPDKENRNGEGEA